MRKIAIITGAGSGIGATIAAELAASQVHVVLLGRDAGRLQTVNEQILSAGNSAAFYRCDVTQSSDIEAVWEEIDPESLTAGLILVNNAGYGGPFRKTDGISEEEWDKVFNTNVKAPFLFCRKLLPVMKENNWGRIINIASVYGSVGGALSAAYAASKHALVGYTKSLAAEWGEYNITCNVVSPGFVDTRMGAGGDEGYHREVIRNIPAGRQGTPQEIARLVSFLASRESGYINGADLVVDGGLTAGRSFHS